MLKEIHTLFVKLGNGLLSRLQYDLTFTYDKYTFLKTRFIQSELLKKKLSNNLYKSL